jgi:hypothetical protein
LETLAFMDNGSLAFRFTSSQGIGSDASALDKTQQIRFLRALSRGNLYLENC